MPETMTADAAAACANVVAVFFLVALAALIAGVGRGDFKTRRSMITIAVIDLVVLLGETVGAIATEMILLETVNSGGSKHASTVWGLVQLCLICFTGLTIVVSLATRFTKGEPEART